MVLFDVEETFRFSELRIMTSVAKQIAVSLMNIDLYHELEQFLINVVKSLVYAIEAKDYYTRGHSERVSEYCMLMADRMKLNDEEKKHLFWASILHDMGKIGISESVLCKPGPLTDEEYEEIKAHPGKGYSILKPIGPLAPSLDGILYHHERCDGRGYPMGLKGMDIPLQARIIAVADTFDAITSDRSYRPKKTKEMALTIIN
jgi:HD-GYP domain-containing protein (c-di-GMP phosphodiesterase class II)